MLHALISNTDMKVAIPIWEGRVSPLMDSACHLLVAEIAGGREVSREIVDIPQTGIRGRTRFISGLGINLLICGAISHQFEQMLTVSGTKASPWFRGDVDDIIVAHSEGNLQNDRFFLPGCRRRRQGRRRYRVSCRSLGRGRMYEEDS